MKLKKITNKYSNGQISYEYYINPKGQMYGYFTQIYSNGQKDFEGSCNFDRDIGLWKWWYSDGIREWIDTREDNRLNGVRIELAE